MKHTKEINEKKQYNFWVSSLSKGREKLASLLSKKVESPDTTPKWHSEGITYLSPNTKNTKNPKNCRPINWLTTTYTLLTSILTERTCTFMKNNNTFPLERKECKRGSYGCKDQPLKIPKDFFSLKISLL